MIFVYTEFGLSSTTNWRDKFQIRRDWCGENCQGQFVHDLLSDSTRWGFELEEDAMAFKLRWV